MRCSARSFIYWIVVACAFATPKFVVWTLAHQAPEADVQKSETLRKEKERQQHEKDMPGGTERVGPKSVPPTLLPGVSHASPPDRPKAKLPDYRFENPRPRPSHSDSRTNEAAHDRPPQSSTMQSPTAAGLRSTGKRVDETSDEPHAHSHGHASHQRHHESAVCNNPSSPADVESCKKARDEWDHSK